MTVTCTAVGGTDPVSYQWSSTCRDCPFQTANSTSVTRAAVRTGDIGNHTCTATSGLISGSKTISFDVVGKQDAINVHVHALVLNSMLSKSYVAIYCLQGAGVHVFNGASTGDLEVPRSLPNNGIVISLGTARFGFYFVFFCRSDSMMRNVGMLIGPDESTVTTGDIFAISHPRTGELRVANALSQNILTAGDQGVYTCRIPLQSEEMRDINVGIYPSGFNSKYGIC